MDKDLEYLKQFTEKFAPKKDEAPRPLTCTKPDCDCAAIEEQRTGGPIKSYPCRALDIISAADQIKSPKL